MGAEWALDRNVVCLVQVTEGKPTTITYNPCLVCGVVPESARTKRVEGHHVWEFPCGHGRAEWLLDCTYCREHRHPDRLHAMIRLY